jgi:hypothetical protein
MLFSWPRSYPPAKHELIGPLYFTNKGVVFVKMTDLLLPSIYTIMVDTTLTSSVMDNTGLKMQTAMRKEALSDVKNAPTADEELRLTLENAEDAFFIPKSAISAIRHTWMFGFVIKVSGRWQPFILENGRKTYKEYRSQIREYLTKR